MSEERESLGSRVGFLLLAAGCAIGMGNVWRFPYITGLYGGAIFLLFYLFFLTILGFPVMMCELAIGRGGQAVLSKSLRKLKAPESRIPWHWWGNAGMFGNLVLLMFYSSVTGWLLFYTGQFAAGTFSTMVTDSVPILFDDLLGDWKTLFLYASIAIVLSAGSCAISLKNSLERITKIMMLGLFSMMLILVIIACSLPNASDGLRFLLQPNLANLKDNGLFDAIHAAMTQAFFTLSLGIGSIAIFGSYIDKSKSLASESIIIIMLDTFVAICAGLIIFPCCYAFGVQPNAGPSLIFITLPKIFIGMRFGSVFGTIFFLFMTTAALSTLMAVTENLIALCIDEWKMRRHWAAALVCIVIIITSLPCILGFNIWSSFQPFGAGSCVLDLEDFIVSDNLLPLGAAFLCIFCTSRYGWGNNQFLQEVNSGNGIKINKILGLYIQYILPFIIFGIWIIGLYKKFF